MTGLVRRAKSAGIRTALLSNSWGNTYPDHLFDGMFDVVVISGEVGMRKPEERIFRYTLDNSGCLPATARSSMTSNTTWMPPFRSVSSAFTTSATSKPRLRLTHYSQPT